jgi:hypothetical protein
MAQVPSLALVIFLVAEVSLQLQPSVEVEEAMKMGDSSTMYNFRVRCPNYCTEKVKYHIIIM